MKPWPVLRSKILTNIISLITNRKGYFDSILFLTNEQLRKIN